MSIYTSLNIDAHRFCVAPMLQCTDRHFRFLARLLTKHSMLYTEMVTTGALIHGNRACFLEKNDCEHPVGLQVGGSDPDEMARTAEFAQEYNYDEININVGCPSERVQAGKFGACLMLEPDTVVNSIKAMKAACDLNVTVKTRIGVDDKDEYRYLKIFVDSIATAGCKLIIVHARKAILSGLSPKENRTIPPLHYETVYRLKQDFPELKIILNGGLQNNEDILYHLKHVDGVMVGREAYENPYFLTDIDNIIFNQETNKLERKEILELYKIYIKHQLDIGLPLKIFTRHIINLFNNISGAKLWRRYLSEHAHKKGAGIEVIEAAQKFIKSSEPLMVVH